jgi:hypothetical protein
MILHPPHASLNQFQFHSTHELFSLLFSFLIASYIINQWWYLIYVLSYAVQEPPIANAERSMVEAEPIAYSAKNDKVSFFFKG